MAAIITAMAAAAAMSPASSRFKIATAPKRVSGDYKNTTAEIVVIAATKK